MACGLTILMCFNQDICRGDPPPEISVKHDFGKTQMIQEWEGEYLLRNDSEETWTVAGIEVSCGCLQAHADSGPVLPGEELPIQLKLDLQNRYGPVSETARLTLLPYPRRGSEGLRTVKIHILGEILPEVLWSPPVLTILDLTHGESRLVKALARFRQPEQKLIYNRQNLGQPNPNVSIRQGLDPEIAEVFFPFLEKEIPDGQLEGNFEIPFRLAKTADVTTSLKVHWTRKSPFTVQPRFLIARRQTDDSSDFFNLDPLEVRRTDGKPFRILFISPPEAWLKIVGTNNGENATSHKLIITVDHTLKIFPRCKLQIITDDPWLPMIEVPLVPEP
ncbi:DUF1573 domain-containing protein [Mesoterricola sediminis]|uniref:DUF1573 domain-containing protein n=1 Tax=Mesoterricola sediminis TaxID=2927980 RepID=A0AA48GY59_9BACT|nr:DUF1573 domain-containing protein [Mesoterricola sediminis]BDU76187.1 hypothetical protein METESE_11450 [Mesoterricola sediminis]